ncbi:hypothetical protein ACQCVE_00110 [Metabacillus sp. 113a]|uniref:hypothetical protein n=1 Tax=Metabacillus sp. 113a TaxID=3404706 RepID=UPI003CF46264
MSRKSIQAFSAGIISATAILSAAYFLSPKEEAVPAEITKKQVQTYLGSEGEVALPRDQYEALVKAKEEAVSNDNKQKEAAKTEEAPRQETYRFSIGDGMSTGEVAQIMEEGGIIPSAKEFASYLIDTDLHRKVRQGKYNLPTGLTNEEAAKYLVKQ